MRYLRGERMLAESSVDSYVPFVRKFLADRFGDGSVRLSRLCAGDVVRFVRRQAPRHCEYWCCYTPSTWQYLVRTIEGR
jgi:hypothetical protein